VAVSIRQRDLALAVVLCLLDVLAFWDRGATSLPWLMIAIGAVGYLPLGWRRESPHLVYALVWAHSVGVLLFVPGARPNLALVLALYSVAAYGGRKWAFAALGAVAVPLALMVRVEYGQAPADEKVDALLATAVGYAVFYFGVWAVGRWRDSHRRFVLESQRRAEAEAYVAVAAERNRIAAELHDIVAHSVTVMVLQAGGARRMDISEDTDRALSHIEQAGQQAMTELRRLLRLVQQDSSQPFQSPPGINEVDGLVRVISSTGPSVELRALGTPTALSPSVDLTAYRVVQEALTNVAKHAGPRAHAVVTLRWEARTLVIEVRDNGREQRAPSLAALSTGHGLIKLRERVQSACGRLSAGPVEGGGFLVEATLPTQRGTVADDDSGPSG
jgi:signal transduction histidine kinase